MATLSSENNKTPDAPFGENARAQVTPEGRSSCPPIDPDSLRSFLASRRSMRRFLIDDISEEIVSGLIDTARHTPSGGNRRAHELTLMPRGATRDALLVELSRIYAKRSALLNSPVAKFLVRPFVGPYLRAFLDDPEYGGRIRELLAKLGRGEDPIFYKAPLVVFFHSKVLIPTPKEDCILAAHAMALAAHAAGLGSCFVTLAQSAVNSSRACKTTLGLTANDQVHAVLLLGRPEERNREPAHRPPLAVHATSPRSV